MDMYATLSCDTVYSPSFLDALRDMLHERSLALYDPESGGFREREESEPTVKSTLMSLYNSGNL